VSWAWPFRRRPEAGRDVPWIPPELGDPQGLVGVGGDLDPPTLLRAYSEGVFPWFSEGDPVLWWSPDPRAVIELGRPDAPGEASLHVGRRLARTIRSGKFRVTVNRCFERVMRACGETRPEGTWVTEDMVAGYTELHRLGHAHSLEVWTTTPTLPPGEEGNRRPAPSLTLSPGGEGGRRPGEGGITAKVDDPLAAVPAPLPGWELAGGIYGVAVGGLFAGESMFYHVTDASKVALVALVGRLRQRGYALFDVQMKTDHTSRMGAVEVPRDEYLRRLREAVQLTAVTFG
jgi:leucyl/phenylalanyl-tRNA--protein transferase